VVLGKLFFSHEVGALSTLLLTYLFLLFRALPAVAELSDQRTQLASLASARARTAEFLSRADKPFMKSGSLPRQRLQHAIRFEGVRFAYPATGAEVLNAFDLTIPRGATVALVGASGSGKTTVGLLLSRLYDPGAGRVTLDGVDLREFDLVSLRRSIAVVSQETFLFNDTVRANIAYGHPEATDEQVREAARRAHALEFIDELPQGLSTRVGDRGVLLSGGQRQRLAIARALLADADILVLDEATSALDSVSERLVQEALDSARQGRTTLVSAHRLSTLDDVDQIAALDGGRVVELGTHDELMRLGGRYARLRSLQSTPTAAARTA
jgi:subfamily B ATP-binding cassette protein MsbA